MKGLNLNSESAAISGKAVESIAMWRRVPFAVALALAVVASASSWFFVNRIMIAQQAADAVAHNIPRGNLSDLYPRWLGARELLRHGRNPYSLEITREIQLGYYGRQIDPTRPDDPRDQQGFAYPAYVVFLLAPTVGLPFHVVSTGFRWLLDVLVVVTVLLWFRSLRWKASAKPALIVIVLMLGWLPVVQALKLQQLTLLVAALLAACGACLAGGWLFLAGGLLALATIKPQLTWPLVLWLLVWVGCDWRKRRRFVFGFGLMMILLLGGAELLLPGWLRMFVAAISQYHGYTRNESVLVPLFGSIAGRVIAVICFLGCAACLRSFRRTSVDSSDFGRSIGLVLALTILIVPMSALYNQVLLAPAIFTLVRREESGTRTLPAVRLAQIVAIVLVAWPWIAAFGLSLAYLWLTPTIRQRVYLAPFYSSLMVPVFVFGLALLDAWMNPPRTLREGAAAE